MSGIQEMMASVAGTPQIASEPFPFWKTITMIPNAAPSDRRLRMTAFTARNTERKARMRRMSVRMITNASMRGNFP